MKWAWLHTCIQGGLDPHFHSARSAPVVMYRCIYTFVGLGYPGANFRNVEQQQNI